jgi:hypothetical protein
VKKKIGFGILLSTIIFTFTVAQANSPAFEAYEELLKAGDQGIKSATYACFNDNSKSTAFRVINGMLMKDTLMVIVSSYKDGVSESNPLVFQGKLSPPSGKNMLFADLVTAITNPISSHENDSFSWSPDTLSFRSGFGKLDGPQLRITYEFAMQRSTGRFTEDTVIHFPDKTNPLHGTGKCIRIPGPTRTPEEEYEFEHEQLGVQ